MHLVSKNFVCAPSKIFGPSPKIFLAPALLQNLKLKSMYNFITQKFSFKNWNSNNLYKLKQKKTFLEIAEMSEKFRQEMPPEGGYPKFNWNRTYPKVPFFTRKFGFFVCANRNNKKNPELFFLFSRTAHLRDLCCSHIYRVFLQQEERWSTFSVRFFKY